MRTASLASILVALAAAISPGSARPDWTGPHGAWHGDTGWHHGGHWHRHSHGGFIFFGSPLFWPGRGDPFDDPFYSFPPAPLVAEPPPVYIERGEGSPPQLAAPGSLWYYCEAAGAYYPYVKECPEGWRAVAPQPTRR